MAAQLTVEVVFSSEVPNLELHERVVGDELDVQANGGLQEQGLVRGHLLKHYSLNA